MPTLAKSDLSHLISQYPSEALGFFDPGFTAAKQLSEGERSLVLEELISNFSRGKRSIEGSELKHIGSLSEREYDKLASVYSILIGLLTDTEATPDEFTEVANGILFSGDNEAVVRSIAELIVRDRGRVKQTISKAQLAGVVLPSLAKLNIAVDARLRIVDSKVTTGVPICVVYIGTDSRNSELWLQLSVADVQDVIKKFTDALNDMKTVESFIADRQ